MSEKYDRIGQDYNQTRKADPYLLSRMQFYLNPNTENTFLDIGCGTGNYTIKLAKNTNSFIGVEPSEHMLSIARQRNSTINWLQGKAEDIPLADNSVDSAIASLTLHHWSSLEEGFKEVKRVLCENGRFVIFTSTSKQMRGYWLNHYFPKMLEDSILQMPTLKDISSALAKADFSIEVKEKYFIHQELEDQFLYCGKNNPQLYLDPNIRNGISSFSDLANAKEIQTGLTMLKKDIQSGKINKIIQEYQNDLGDYLFISCQSN